MDSSQSIGIGKSSHSSMEDESSWILVDADTAGTSTNDKKLKNDGVRSKDRLEQSGQPSNGSKNSRVIAKKRRNSGLSYVTTRNGQKVVREERQIRRPCDSCRFKCPSKFTEDERRAIFERFWSLGDIGEQRLFLAGSIDSVNPQYRRVADPSGHKRARRVNYAFYFRLDSTKIRVCKVFFINTLGINGRPFRTLREKIDNQDDIMEDGRGKHRRQKKLDPAVTEDVKKFVNSSEQKPVRCYSSFKRIQKGIYGHLQNQSEVSREDHQQNFEMDADQGASKSREPADENFTFAPELIKVEPESEYKEENFKNEFDEIDCSPLRTPLEVLPGSEDETPKNGHFDEDETHRNPIKTESTENDRPTSADAEFDPVDAFFSAMASSVKTLPTTLQLQVKQKVAAAVFEAESAFLSGNF